MWSHFLVFISRTWDQFLAWNSATTFSILKETFIIPLTVFVFTLWISIGSEFWKPSVFKARGREVLKAFVIAVVVPVVLVAAVFVVAIPVTVYRDHQELVARIRRLSQENIVLGLRMNNPAPADISRPTDPSLVKVGATLSLVASVRSALRNRAHVDFIVTASPDNEWVKSDIEGLLLEACDNSNEIRVPCTVIPVSALDRSNGVIPRPKQQGISIHVREPIDIATLIEKSQGVQPLKPLIDAFPGALSTWYTIHKTEYFPDAISEKFAAMFHDSVFVWIEIGPGLPWKDNDVRLRDGMTQSAIDKLAGRDTSIKERLLSAAAKISAIQSGIPRAPERAARMPSIGAEMQIEKYKRLLPELIRTIRDARMAGVDTGNAESLAMKATGYEDFETLKSLLSKFSGDEAIK
jgi:hypothetical protein